MRTVRPPAVAGSFYPRQAAALREQVDRLLLQARDAIASPPPRPKALIVPHAGYIYSGPTAAAGYVMLDAAPPRRVVLLGPAHYVGFAGLALSSADAFETPLGEVEIDHEAVDVLASSGLPQVFTSDGAHAPEHSLEVQLPFLQRVLGDFTLVPVVVGDAAAQEVRILLDACWGGDDTVVVISSDLSHYLPYDDARIVDADTVRRILQLRYPLREGSACGLRGINGLLAAAPGHGLRPRLVDQRNSGDTAGDRNRVVGYASIAFEEGDRNGR